MTGRGIRAGNLKVKRVYEPVSPDDGTRILIDRLWPRGLAKAEAAIDRWLKEIAPSNELRHWYGHEPSRWLEFQRRYARELSDQAALLEELRDLARKGPVTLLFGSREARLNNAVALRGLLMKLPAPARPRSAPRARTKRTRPASIRSRS
ncbi:MAG: DUF488 domain-containing protein [Pseudomonadota bacterium]